MMSATYSPDDNKLRLYSVSRLAPEMYERVRAAGFRWAPKQELFVCPAWSPEAEDLLLELCGEIDDEDKSLADRAEERAERFEEYSDKRAGDAESARRAVSAIAGNIPLGQPILVGHHSEKHARRDAERIENGMRKAVKMWETSKYWTDRAAGALRHAKYKERPDVRARRIKKIEADMRRVLRSKAESERWLKAWTTPGLTLEVARKLANVCWLHVTKVGDHQYTAYDVLRPDGERYANCPAWTVEQVQEVAQTCYPRSITMCERWIAHLQNRLAYEKTMLEEQGATELLAKKPRPKQLPLCNYRAPDGLDIENIYCKGEFIHYPQVEMTQAEFAKIHSDYKGTRVVGNSHRVRTAYTTVAGKRQLVSVFLTDSKVHERVADQEPAPRQERAAPKYRPPVEKPAADTAFEAMKDSLKQGVKVVTAPELFVTPPAIAERIVAEAAIEPGMTVLEPSAGTGALVKAVKDAEPTAQVTAVELNQSMAQALGARCADFLDLGAAELGHFDRVVMNPPFSNEVAHVEHAAQMLKPGGRLVAVMSAGVTFRSDRKTAAFRAEVERLGGVIELLPEDSFEESGTGVRTVLVTIDSPEYAMEVAA